MDSQQQPQIDPSYLDEIAQPTDVKEEGIPMKTILIFGGIGLVAVIALLITLATLSPSKNSSTVIQKLAGKIVETNYIANDAVKNKKLKDKKMRSLGSDIAISITDLIESTAPSFRIEKIEINKGITNKSVRDLINLTETKTTLEDARLNANYDEVYAIEMNHLLTTLLLLMEQSEKKTNNVDFLAALQKGRDNLTPLKERLELFSNEGSNAID